MSSKGSSIHDVARRAGVAVSTVSKALNNKPGISPALRAKISLAAEDLHYVPNALTRSLLQGTSHTIGVHVWDILKDPYLSILPALLRGLTEGVKELDCDMLVFTCLPSRNQNRMAATFLDGRVDAIVTIDGGTNIEGLTALAKAQLPAVVIYSKDVPNGVGYVAVDNISGINEAVDHLVELGHKYVAYYGERPQHDFLERASAYQERLAFHGIQAEPALCIIANDDKPNVRTFCDIVLVYYPRPTAVIACTDAVAYEIMVELKNRGIRVPEDISLVGFDGVAQEQSVPITTISTSAFEVGKLAVKYLSDMLNGASASDCRKIMPVTFVRSGSTGPAPTP